MQPDTRRCLIACGLLAVAWAGASVVHGRRSAPVNVAFDARVVPLEAAGFVGADSQDTSQIEQALGAQSVLYRVYRKPSEAPVRVTVVYGTDWRSIHAPTGCYPAQGWQVQSDEEVRLAAPAGCRHEGPLHARILHAMKDGRDEYALFLYAFPGGTTADWAREGWAVATGRSGAGGLVIITSTEVKPGASGDAGAEAQRRLTALLSALYVPVVSFWDALQAAPSRQPVSGGG